MEIILANPRGFCAGVDRAIEIVERAIQCYGAPVYVRHQVVHNRYVVEGLRAKGAVFVEEIGDVPYGAIVIFSAHGVAAEVRTQAEVRKLRVFDATCPLVTKVHVEVGRHQLEGRECILIGHAGHPEVEGTLGQYQSAVNRQIYLVESVADAQKIQIQDAANIAYVTQTTLSIDDTKAIIKVLRARFPKLAGPKKDDICYATQNRQDAVKSLARRCEVMLVVGSANSSNSNRLREVSENIGTPAHLIDGPENVQRQWLQGIKRIGITAGASAPEVLVQDVVKLVQEWGGHIVNELPGIHERVVFSLPKALQQ